MPRKQKEYHFIYKTINLLTGKYYYGIHSTDNLEDGYLGSGKRLSRSINKYGKENHKREIIEFCKNRKELKKREEEIVNLNEVAKKDCMNLIVGGQGGFVSVENQLERSIAGNAAQKVLKETDPEWVKKRSRNKSIAGKKSYEEGRRERIYFYDWTGKKQTEETKDKMRISAKGKHVGNKNSQYGKCWICNGKENKIIKKEELDKYLNQGWFKGRKIENNQKKT